MAKKRGRKGSISFQFGEIADEVMNTATETIEKALDEVLPATAEDLRNNSPQESGDYARSWTFKKEGHLSGIVYNEEHYRLTHLLEKGHVVANQFGKLGSTRKGKRVHIKPARDRADKLYFKTVKKELDKNL